MTNNIHQDFINAQKDFEPARRNSVNPHFKSKYADLSECIDAVKDALNKNNFYLKQVNHECDSGVAIETLLVHVTGEHISSGILRVPASKEDAQGYGSAMTYARRYSLLAVCGIAPEDDDGNSVIPTQNKPTLQQKLDKWKQAQSKSKSKENLILEAEQACSKGYNDFVSWYKTTNENERKLIADKMQHFKSKCEEADNLNQDIL